MWGEVNLRKACRKRSLCCQQIEASTSCRGEPATKRLCKSCLPVVDDLLASPPFSVLPFREHSVLCRELEGFEIEWLKRTFSILRIFPGFRIPRLTM